MAYRLARSTRVAIWDLPALPIMRSPSRDPGTARSAASTGRSLMLAMPVIFPLATTARDRLTRGVRPWRRAILSWVRNSPRACRYTTGSEVGTRRLSGFRLVRFLVPPPEPGVPIAEHRAPHKSRWRVAVPHAVFGQDEGIRVPR